MTVVRFSERLMAESGVRHGQFNVIAVEPAHRHAHGESDSKHIHYRPITLNRQSEPAGLA